MFTLPLRRASAGLTWQSARLDFGSPRLGTRVSSTWKRRGFSVAADAAGAAGGIPAPTGVQLRRTFVNSAVPFVAFGIVDQTVLIYMGETIDMTLGVHFGLPTLGAAAVGQIFSDTSGVLCGSSIEALALYLGLPRSGLTDVQRSLRVVRRMSTFGCVCGVITGCLIGMLNLLVIDLHASERLKRAEELKTVMKTVMDGGRNVLGCLRATLWIVDEETGELWSSVAHGMDDKIIRIPCKEEGSSIAAWVLHHKELVNIPDVKKDDRWMRWPTSQTTYIPKSMLCAPVMKGDEVVAIIQLLDKRNEEGDIVAFDKSDEKLMVMMAAHTRIFMHPEEAGQESPVLLA